MSITTTVKTIQDIMRKDAGVDGDAQRIGQLVWMLFLKIFDDREQEYELVEEDYRSPVPERLRWRSWAADAEGITGDRLLDFVNNDLFPTLKELPVDAAADPRGLVVRQVFEDAYNYMKSGTLMRQVVNKLNEIDFNRTGDRHLFGDIYEQILRDLQNAGNAGEYYTPRAVTRFMVDMVAPRLGETVLDPACGTGGFLTATIERIRASRQGHRGREDAPALDPRRRKEAAPASAVRHQHAAPRHPRALADPPRQHAGPPAARLHCPRPRRRHPHQSALRRHGGRRHRVELPR